MDAVETTVAMTMEQAEAAVRSALAEQGFGVLTEIDVAATLKTKIDVDRPPLKILGACNPTFANRALQLDESVALLLPCNVVLAAVEGGTKVSAVDPTSLMEGEEFQALAAEARAKLAAAIGALSGRTRGV